MRGKPDHGLSPRVRGNRPEPAAAPALVGSIPACAGEPYAQLRALQVDSVYPRVCGGTSGALLQRVSALGLSPRVRGNRGHRHRAPCQCGSIPACAGEPCIAGPSLATKRVYPRVCGGTLTSNVEDGKAGGLSPRVRGNPEKQGDRPNRGRSIPACAGEPCAYLPRPTATEVYPRVCGGTRAGQLIGRPLRGLSPRVRENRRPAPGEQGRMWSIPACAGEPGTDAISPRQIQVYPRVCGGTALRIFTYQNETGLSPRVRGNPF